ncbi:MAG: hypothetical protein COU69_04650 [Candidatus Pacebacteria bacterium CG10_big_fil_rev_8_21_14_0_10_56_10]|nr:MAG: hypothetical protein COU69_04650 [Candidatus Pacebacteria bacterium CG10_big_fil_rev_8_21_14_0_10_56_10]
MALGLALITFGWVLTRQAVRLTGAVSTSAPVQSPTQPQPLQLVPPAHAQGGSCDVNVGNNTAAPFLAGGDFTETDYTLALLVSSADIDGVVKAISSGGNIIIRVGAGTKQAGPEAAEYAQLLDEISRRTDSAAFTAMAGRNEVNCAEASVLSGGGIDAELKFMGDVINGVTTNGDGHITFITGQVDHYCDVSQVQEPNIPPPAEWVGRLAQVPGIAGVSLPLYVLPAFPTAQAALDHLRQFAALADGQPIYITESGPLAQGNSGRFEELLREYLQVVPQAASLPNLKTLLVFNSLGLNSEFRDARPFWSFACRHALQTACNDPEFVFNVCQGPQSDYFLYPIAGLAPPSSQPIPNPQRRQLIRQDLAAQGYQVQCSAPSFVPEFVIEGDTSDIPNNISSGLPNPIQLELEAEQVFDFSQVTIPLFRQGSSGSGGGLFDSIENFFGFRDTSGPTGGADQANQSLRSAPIYSLLTLEQQCRQSKDILQTVDRMCNTLEFPQTCPLYDQPVPGLGQRATYRDAIAKLDAVKCSNLDKADPLDRDAILNVPYYLNQAYRLGFLVVSTKLEETQQSPGNPSISFNFLEAADPQDPPQPDEQVRVIVFRLPDVGTNKNYFAQLDENDPANIYYQDGLDLTRDVLRTQQQNQQFRRQVTDQRQQFQQLLTDTSGPIITCNGAEPCTTDNPIVLALTDLINTHGQECNFSAEELPFEPTNTIGSSGQVRAGAETSHDNARTIESLADDSISQNVPNQLPYDFLSNLLWQAPYDGGQPGAKTSIESYLITPQGVELEDIQNTLAGVFFTLDTIQTAQAIEGTAELPRYLRVNDTFSEFRETGSRGFTYRRRTNPAGELCVLDELGRLPDGCGGQINPAIQQQPQEAPRILGAVLGHWMVEIQKSLHGINSGFHRFLSSCQTTEDFLLGRCGDQQLPGGQRGRQLTSFGGSCQLGTGPCSVDNLHRFFGSEELARQASQICNRESGSNPLALNDTCLSAGGSVDYSVGLFQYNLLVPGRCRRFTTGGEVDIFADGRGRPQSDPNYDPFVLPCQVINPQALQDCRAHFLDADNNISQAVELRSQAGSWKPWSAAQACQITK